MRRLATGEETDARAVVAGLGLRERAPLDGPAGPRPRVAGIMIASADGRATIEGRSVKLGHPEDRALLRELRTATDVVLAGARTIEAERYATLLDDDQRALREEQGQSPHPVVATISRDLSLEVGDVPLFTEGVPVAVYTEADGTLDGVADEVAVHRLDSVDFPHVLAHLHAEYGARAVACEGGPSLLRALAEQGCLDELLLTLAPLLVAGDGPTAMTGDALDPAPELTLADVLRADDHLFLHYAA